LEAFDAIAAVSGTPMLWDYVDQHRSGDHICYISDLSKMRRHYPGWDITKSLADIFAELHAAASLATLSVSAERV
jgi:CDP-paratose 2-epimerase